jgi:hypothetical protein
VFFRNPFVQVFPLKVGQLGRKQPAIPFEVAPMALNLDLMEINHPLPSP